MNIPDYLKSQIAELDKKISEAERLLSDPSLSPLAQEEIKQLKEQKEILLGSAQSSGSNGIMKQSGNQQFNSCLLEFRPGPGGEEARLWAEELMRMYIRFANLKGWKVNQLDDSTIKIQNPQAYNLLKSEGGVHRVQRIPVTEASGRIHTSTASVAVLPEIPESIISIKPDDLVISFTHASGHGGQNVNKVATAVRLVHKPTGIVIESQSQRFQEQNRKIALEILRSKLWRLEEEKRIRTINDARLAIGRGMRPEKIRTYNFPQDRITDHRIKKSWHNLNSILDGNINQLLEDIKKSCLTRKIS